MAVFNDCTRTCTYPNLGLTAYKNAVNSRTNANASCARQDGQQNRCKGTVNRKYSGQKMLTTDTGENIEEQRLYLAKRVCADMKDSRCHATG